MCIMAYVIFLIYDDETVWNNDKVMILYNKAWKLLSRFLCQ